MTNANAMTARKLMNSLHKNVEARDNFETAANSAQKISDKLRRYLSLDHKTLQTTRTVEYFQKLVDAQAISNFDFMNDHHMQNKRFNVYAIEKVAAKLDSVAQNKLLKADATAQKYCLAILLHLLKNADKEEHVFERKHALSMLSAAQRFEAIARTDFELKFSKTGATANTQVSSSFRAMQALDILRFEETSKERSIVRNVNYEHAFVRLVAKAYNIDLDAIIARRDAANEDNAQQA